MKRMIMENEKVHYAITEASDQVYQVYYKNELILESNQVVVLKEHYNGNDLRPVIYFDPRAISGLEIAKTNLSSTCPIKAVASYWSYKEAENGIWSYEMPKENMSQIKGLYAFDQTKKFRVKPKTT